MQSRMKRIVSFPFYHSLLSPIFIEFILDAK